MTENDMQKLNEISNEIERLKQTLVESSSINAEVKFMILNENSIEMIYT
jgi:hypothetical protein